MRLYVILPGLEPALVRRPSVCPRCGCQAEHLKRHQQVLKPVQDTENNTVPTNRYRCPKCGSTFRAYPQGVGRDALSHRIKDVAVLLHLMGLSYQSVADGMEALGLHVSKTRICAAVREARDKPPGLERRAVFSAVHIPEPAADGIQVKCEDRWLTLRLASTDATGLVLVVEDVPDGIDGALGDWSRSVQAALDVRLLFDGDGRGA